MIDYQEQAETLRRRCAKLQTRVEEAEAQAADALTQAEQVLADNRVLLPLAVNYQFLRDSADSLLVVRDEAGKDYGVKWKPSIHMPRDACRIELEIKRVDVQRLQDISDLDAIAEGCYGGDSSIPGYRYNALPAEHFMHLWNSINGPTDSRH